MKINAEVTNEKMTLKNDETPPKTFVIPRDRFLATFNAMMRAKELKDGEKHLAELRPQSELIPPETGKGKKKGIGEKFREVQKAARSVATGMESVRVRY